MVQAWGMTETSPLASVAWPQERMRDWSEEEITDGGADPGRAAPPRRRGQHPGRVGRRGATTVRRAPPRDGGRVGASMGDLLVRGPWVVDSYLHGQGAENFTADGWFKTGDVAVPSASGYFVIADRTKDLIKSGGEWISSVDMEDQVMRIDKVVEAAVIAVPDPKWQERPLVCVVLKPARGAHGRRGPRPPAGRGLRQVATARAHRGDRRRAPHVGGQVRQESAAGPVRLRASAEGWAVGGRGVGA